MAPVPPSEASVTPARCDELFLRSCAFVSVRAETNAHHSQVHVGATSVTLTRRSRRRSTASDSGRCCSPRQLPWTGSTRHLGCVPPVVVSHTEPFHVASNRPPWSTTRTLWCGRLGSKSSPPPPRTRASTRDCSRFLDQYGHRKLPVRSRCRWPSRPSRPTVNRLRPRWSHYWPSSGDRTRAALRGPGVRAGRPEVTGPPVCRRPCSVPCGPPPAWPQRGMRQRQVSVPCGS
jgi:hypothetical protein